MFADIAGNAGSVNVVPEIAAVRDLMHRIAGIESVQRPRCRPCALANVRFASCVTMSLFVSSTIVRPPPVNAYAPS